MARLIGRMRAIQRMVVFAAGFGCGLHGTSPIRHALLAAYAFKLVTPGCKTGCTVGSPGPGPAAGPPGAGDRLHGDRRRRRGGQPADLVQLSTGRDQRDDHPQGHL